MDKQQVFEYNTLVNEAATYIEENEIFSDKYQADLKKCWRYLQTLMIEIGLNEFNEKSAVKLMEYNKADPSYKQLPAAIKQLRQYYVQKKIHPINPSQQRRTYTFNGSVGDLARKFIESVRQELSRSRVRSLELYLHPFATYCFENRISEYSLENIVKYITQFKGAHYKLKLEVLTLIRFTRQLYADGIINFDFSSSIPRAKTRARSKIPSVYSEEEIHKMALSIERSSPTGKRDYAVFVTIWRLGIRSVDLRNLQFQHLNLENKMIRIHQSKTKKLLTLPLHDQVKNAIVDYLKYGRKESKEPFIFLQHKYPRSKMSATAVYRIISRAITASGVKVADRRVGPHSLRSSLASNMLDNDVPITVIKEVLGHSILEVSKHYTRVDINTLSKCLTDVQPIDERFYTENSFIR